MTAEPHKEYPQDVVRGTFFEHDVPVEKIFVHFRTEPGGYARPLRVWRVNKIDAEFDPQALGVLLLSMRDNGMFACIDGQHRWEVAKRKGHKTVTALVYIDLTLEDEARLYRKFGDYLKQTALDRYHAGVAERLPEYLAIQRVVGSHHLHVPQTLGTTPNTIDAVDALLNVTKTYGLEGLDQTLGLLHDVWDGEHRAYRAMMLNGTGAFLVRFRDKINFKRKRLTDRMERMGISKIEQLTMNIKEANLASNPTAAWGQALLALHDKGIDATRQLGDWPKRHYTEQTKAIASKNLTQLNANLTPEERTRRALLANANMTEEQKRERSLKAGKTKRGYSIIQFACEYCHAGEGAPCVSRSDVDLPGYHEVRRRTARAWAESKLKP